MCSRIVAELLEMRRPISYVFLQLHVVLLGFMLGDFGPKATDWTDTFEASRRLCILNTVLRAVPEARNLLPP